MFWFVSLVCGRVFLLSLAQRWKVTSSKQQESSFKNHETAQTAPREKCELWRARGWKTPGPVLFGKKEIEIDIRRHESHRNDNQLEMKLINYLRDGCVEQKKNHSIVCKLVAIQSNRYLMPHFAHTVALHSVGILNLFTIPISLVVKRNDNKQSTRIYGINFYYLFT